MFPIAQPHLVAAAVAALFASWCGPARAQEPDPAQAERQAFIDRADVQDGLAALASWSGHHGPSRELADFHEPCWQAARKLLPGEPFIGLLHVDACLSAATRHLHPDARYTRTDKSEPGLGPAGIGILFSHAEGKGFRVDDVYPGSPAEQAGIQEGEHITAIDGQPLAALPRKDILARLRGEAGTEVRLSLSPVDGVTRAARELVVIRQALRFPSTYALPMADAWYIQVRDFNASDDEKSAAQTVLAQAAGMRERVPNPKALVLDLRGNLGGVLAQIFEFATLLLPPEHAVLLSFDQHGADQQATRSSVHGRWALPAGTPLVVLVDAETGAGTEWLAEALRRQAGALVVGATTAGGVLVRTGYDNRGELRGTRFELPAGQLFAVGGSLFHGQGVVPDDGLDASRLALRPMGRVPPWLPLWLSDSLPSALGKQAQRQARAWQAAAAVVQGQPEGARPWCLGSLVMSVPVPLRAWRLSGAQLSLETSRWSMAVRSAADDGLFVAPEVALREDIARHEAELKRLRTQAGSAPQARRWLVDALARLKARRADVGSWVVGPGLTVHVDGEEHWLQWHSEGLRHRLVLDGEASTREGRLLAYRALVARWQPQPEGLASGQPGVCLPDGFVRLDEPVKQLRWDGQWQATDQTEAQVHRDALSMAGFVLPVGAEPAQDDYWEALVRQDTWLLDGVRACRGLGQPVLSLGKLAGAEAVYRQQGAQVDATGDDGRCGVLRAASRGVDVGQGLRMSWQLGVSSPLPLSATSSAMWRQAWQAAGVLPWASTAAAPAPTHEQGAKGAGSSRPNMTP